ncbi:MAG: type II toxin-antitoxin system HicA family toxin [Oscillospiraceae bacterium]|nr:type II toxin-antitoxin system HicA family toxin [Oscillospiraceae bacterium]
MSKKTKLLSRFLLRPVDFSFDELVRLLGQFGYFSIKSGKTGGSRVTFTDGRGDYLRIHKPHPRNILKLYQVDDVIESLKERGLI